MTSCGQLLNEALHVALGNHTFGAFYVLFFRRVFSFFGPRKNIAC